MQDEDEPQEEEAPVEEAPLVLQPEPDEPEPPQEPPPRRRSLIRRLALWALMIVVVLPVGCTAAYRLVPPPVTILMAQRVGQGYGLERHWVPMRKISPNLAYAVVAAEDAKFCEHDGFDFEAMKKAMRNNERGRKLRGGSTVSQQTAKNVFLWPNRSYVRKGLEAYYTVLIETLWGKRRIMEVYLNTVEWGPGIYGAEAAARRNFGVPASQLSATQAARLAAILPSPLKWKAANPGPYVRRRSGRIAAAMGTVRAAGLADCLKLAGAPARTAPKTEARRKAAEDIMRETAPPPLPEEEEDEAAPPAEPPAPIAVDPAPLELPPPTDVPPPSEEPPAAT